MSPVVNSSNDDDDVNKTLLLWTKIGFIIVGFLEAFICGMFPTWSTRCRTNPSAMGIANAFAGGVFLGIAIMHITPEEIAAWDEMRGPKDKIFPLPEFLLLSGYTLILVVDKVLFDTHGMFDGDGPGHADPAQAKLEKNLESSMSKAAALKTHGDPKASRAEQKEGVESAMKEFLNPTDRFAARVKASLKSDDQATDEDLLAQ